MKRSWGIALALCVACGDDDGGGGGGGTGDAKRVDSLSVAEFRDFCEWTVEHEADAVSLEQYCTIDAVESSTDEAECTEYYEMCVEEEQEFWDSDLEDALEGCAELEQSDLPEDCSVTLGEVRDCYEALDEELSQAARSFKCEMPGETLPDEPPAACTRIEDDCPDLVADAATLSRRLPPIASARKLLRP